jgi:hypothetical protein
VEDSVFGFLKVARLSPRNFNSLILGIQQEADVLATSITGPAGLRINLSGQISENQSDPSVDL